MQLALAVVAALIGASALAQSPAPATDRPTARAAAPSASYDDLVMRARASLKANDANGALSASKQAIALDDRRWEAYVAAAGAYSLLSLHDDAIGMLQFALARAPEDRRPLIRDALADTRRALSPPASTAGAASATPMSAPGPATAPTQAEVVLWKSIEKSSRAADFAGYLETYPNGTYSALARRRAAALAEEVRNLAGVGKITEVQGGLRYVVFEVAPGGNVAVGDTVVVKVGDDELLEMTVQRRYGSAASATARRGTIDGIGVGAGVFKRDGGAR